MTIPRYITKERIRNLSADYFEGEIEAFGMDIDFDVLQFFVDNASHEIHDTPQYQYYWGMLHGRMIEAGLA